MKNKFFTRKFVPADQSLQVVEGMVISMKINSGGINYEDCEYSYAQIFEEIWQIMKENGDGNFIEIDDDLSY